MPHICCPRNLIKSIHASHKYEVKVDSNSFCKSLSTHSPIFPNLPRQKQPFQQPICTIFKTYGSLLAYSNKMTSPGLTQLPFFTRQSRRPMRRKTMGFIQQADAYGILVVFPSSIPSFLHSSSSRRSPSSSIDIANSLLFDEC